MAEIRSNVLDQAPPDSFISFLEAIPLRSFRRQVWVRIGCSPGGGAEHPRRLVQLVGFGAVRPLAPRISQRGAGPH